MTEPSDEMVPLGDRYEIGGLLGRGGMADVHRGRDLRLGRPVAIKQLRADLAADETFLERFRREAQSAASLNHPAIVAVYDTGEAPDANGNVLPYIVMELVEGRTLRDVLREGRRILPERALSITAEILSALDYSHRAGIIHRDIKPANIMLTPDGKVKVMDFGIARAISDTSSAMTQTAAVIGTAQYLSPEQARGKTVDARSDIYSTGCVLYELLTGRPPFIGESPVSVAYQHVREEARPPSQLNPDVSLGMDRIVAKALAKDLEQRYSSAADMRAEIEQALAGGTIDAPTQAVPTISGATAIVPAVDAPLATGAEDEEEKSGKGKWWAIGLVIVALLAMLGFVLFMNQEDPPPEMATVPMVAGQDVETATNLIESKGLTVGEQIPRSSMDVEAGLVIGTDPEAGDSIEVTVPVDLIVSSGPEDITIPDVQHLSYAEAKELLEGERFQLVVKKEVVASSEPKDRVLNSKPSAGQSVPMGSTITLIISEGQVEVPNLVGKSLDDAKKILGDLGLKHSVNEDPTSLEPDGTVIAQNRPENQSVAPGTTITLTVSRPAVPSPDPEEPGE